MAFLLMDTPVAQTIQFLKEENRRLKWILVQFMQRMGKDLVIFHMKNPQQFGMKIEEVPERQEIHIRVKRLPPRETETDEKVPDSPGNGSLN